MLIAKYFGGQLDRFSGLRALVRFEGSRLERWTIGPTEVTESQNRQSTSGEVSAGCG